jgi:hypothetical protein
MTYRFLIVLCLFLGGLKARAAAVLGIDFARDLRDRIVSNYSEEDIMDRLKTMYSIVEVALDQDVLDQVKRFILSDRTFSRRILHRKELYFPLIEKTLQENQLPAELKYLAAIESGLNPSARSGVGAGGLWQLMPATARIRGLKVDEKVDQRFDPVRATQAAASYLQSLFQIFGDWSLALAAYNCGENKVLDAMQKAGSRDFWEVRKLLPRQTQLFVPAYIGLSYMIRYADVHNLQAEEEPGSYGLLTFIRIDKEVNIDKMAKATGMDKLLFRSFNPAYRRAIIPRSEKGHYITLPDSLAIEFVDYYSKLPSPHHGEEQTEIQLLPGGVIDLISFTRPIQPQPQDIEEIPIEPVAYDPGSYTRIEEKPALQAESSKDYIYHIVKSRESLSDIASLYDQVQVEDLMRWNEIDPSRVELKKGTLLLVKR